MWRFLLLFLMSKLREAKWETTCCTALYLTSRVSPPHVDVAGRYAAASDTIYDILPQFVAAAAAKMEKKVPKERERVSPHRKRAGRGRLDLLPSSPSPSFVPVHAVVVLIYSPFLFNLHFCAKARGGPPIAVQLTVPFFSVPIHSIFKVDSGEEKVRK